MILTSKSICISKNLYLHFYHLQILQEFHVSISTSVRVCIEILTFVRNKFNKKCTKLSSYGNYFDPTNKKWIIIECYIFFDVPKNENVFIFYMNSHKNVIISTRVEYLNKVASTLYT